MESLIFRLFEMLFRAIAVLIATGLILGALIDVQKRAYDSKKRGLASLLYINQQLVGK